MKFMRLNLSLAVIPAFLLFFSSCLDSETDSNGFGDAYILVEVVGQDTLKGLGLHAYSYSEFTSVNVHLSGNEGKVYTLEPYLGYKQDFVWSTPLAEFTTALPAAGTYIFNATFRNGQTHLFSDLLYAATVSPPEILRCEFFSSGERIETEWKPVPGADMFSVRLMNESGDVLFVSAVLPPTQEIYSFGKSTPGWQTTSQPQKGQNLTVEVSSYLLEPSRSASDLQSIGKSRINIVYGN